MNRFKILAVAVLLLNTFALGWIRVTNVETDERQSTVAWLNNQYLICWSDARDWGTYSAATIHGARISVNGSLIDTNSFLIDGGYPDRLMPKICAGNSSWIIAYQQGC
jgi:hypothetical protein